MQHDYGQDPCNYRRKNCAAAVKTQASL